MYQVNDCVNWNCSTPPIGHRRQPKLYFNAKNTKQTQRAPSEDDFDRFLCELGAFLAISAFKFVLFISNQTFLITNHSLSWRQLPIGGQKIWDTFRPRRMESAPSLICKIILKVSSP